MEFNSSVQGFQTIKTMLHLSGHGYFVSRQNTMTAVSIKNSSNLIFENQRPIFIR